MPTQVVMLRSINDTRGGVLQYPGKIFKSAVTSWIKRNAPRKKAVTELTGDTFDDHVDQLGPGLL